MNNENTNVIPLYKAVEHTPDWLRSFEGCVRYNDDEAQAILDGLDLLAVLLLGIAAQKLHIDNQQFISDNSNKDFKIAA